MKHELKILPEYYKAVRCGDKTFEIRLNDRNFQERDEVELHEWNPVGGYTGNVLEGFIRYITDYEQKPNYVVFSVVLTGETQA